LREVGGAQPAERASTDGCLRLTSTCSEGAVAEREGFEPSGGVGKIQDVYLTNEITVA